MYRSLFPRDVFAEMKHGMHSLDHISWERLEAEESVTYPCPAVDAPGLDVVFGVRFPQDSGRALFRPTVPLPPEAKASLPGWARAAARPPCTPAGAEPAQQRRSAAPGTQPGADRPMAGARPGSRHSSLHLRHWA